MNNIKIKSLNLILLIDFVIYIFTNLIIHKLDLTVSYSIFLLCIRDIIIFLFSIVIYMYSCNSQVCSKILFPKINNKIIKNSIIMGISFYFIANGANLLLIRFFKFSTKSAIYLNNVYDLFDFGFGFFVYIFVYTICTEIVFRVMFNDVFKNFSYKLRLVIPSILFSIFFFELSQLFYGIVLGILLMGFFDKVKNIMPVIISSLTVNVLNYLVRWIGKNFLLPSIPRIISSTRGDIFIEFLFPIIIILIGLFICSILQDKIKSKKNNKKSSNNITAETNVIKLEHKNSIKDIFDKYLLLFLSLYLLITIIGYMFFS